MSAVALALLLVTSQSREFLEDEVVPRGRSPIADYRAGGGGMAIVDVDGTAPAGETGIEFVPWGPVALRLTLGAVVRVGWGAFFVTPEAVFRALPRHALLSPYLAAGLQAGFVNITWEARHHGMNEIQSAAGSVETGHEMSGDGGGAGPTPLRFTAGPQLTGGVRFQAFREYALDVGVRYALLRWQGAPYHAYGVVLTVCAPN